jgi:hypothetical protein
MAPLALFLKFSVDGRHLVTNLGPTDFISAPLYSPIPTLIKIDPELVKLRIGQSEAVLTKGYVLVNAMKMKLLIQYDFLYSRFSIRPLYWSTWELVSTIVQIKNRNR